MPQTAGYNGFADARVVAVRTTHLNSGNIQSCGCLAREIARNLRLGKPGRSLPNRQTPEYRAWKNMKVRCFWKDFKQWDDYGGRGITVCSRWLESDGKGFDNFFADMGPKPSPKHSLDRKNNDGNYEPSNCRWATKKEQANNKTR